MKIFGTSVDLLYACGKWDISITLDFDEKSLRSLDQRSLQSLNGYRDSEFILKSVPDVAKFQTLLKLVKLWAQRRGVYSDKFGFLGGFSWAILASFVCKNFASLSIQQLVCKFFKTFSEWEWSQPIFITPSSNYQPNKKKDLMVVMTCVKPFKNSTQHISRSTKQILREELHRADTLCKEIEEPWRKLVERENFFSKYQNYLCITCSALTDEEFRTGAGWLDSMLMVLIYKLELIQQLILHPYIAKFHNEKSNFPFSCFYFIGLTKDTSKENITKVEEKSSKQPTKTQQQSDFTSAIQNFIQIFDTWEGKTIGMDLLIKQIKSEKLPEIVKESSLQE